MLWFVLALTAQAGGWHTLETAHTSIHWADGDAHSAGQAARAAEIAWAELYGEQEGSLELVLSPARPPLREGVLWVPTDGRPIDRAVFQAVAGAVPVERSLIHVGVLLTAEELHARGDAGHTGLVVDLNPAVRPWSWWGPAYGRLAAHRAGLAPWTAEERWAQCAAREPADLATPEVGAGFLAWVSDVYGEDGLTALGALAEAGGSQARGTREVFSLSLDVAMARWRAGLDCPTPSGVALGEGILALADGPLLARDDGARVHLSLDGASLGRPVAGRLLDVDDDRVLIARDGLLLGQVEDGVLRWERRGADARLAALGGQEIALVTGPATLSLLGDDGQALASFPEGARILGLDWLDTNRLVVSLERRAQVDLWTLDVGTGAWTRLTDSAARELSPRVDPEGKLLFSSDEDGQIVVRRLDLATGEGWVLPGLSSTVVGPATGGVLVASPEGGLYRALAPQRIQALPGLCGVDVSCEDADSAITWKAVDLGADSRSTRYRPLRRWRWSGAPVGLLGATGAGIGAEIGAEDPLLSRTFRATGLLGRYGHLGAGLQWGAVGLEASRTTHSLRWTQLHLTDTDPFAIEAGDTTLSSLWEDRHTLTLGTGPVRLVGGVEAVGLRAETAVPLARAALGDLVLERHGDTCALHLELGARQVLERPLARGEADVLQDAGPLVPRALGRWEARVPTSPIEHLELGLYGGWIGGDLPPALQLRMGDRPGVGPLADHAPMYGYASGAVSGKVLAVARAGWAVGLGGSADYEVVLQAGLGQVWGGPAGFLGEALDPATPFADPPPLQAELGDDALFLTEAGLELRASPVAWGQALPVFLRVTRPGQTVVSYRDVTGEEQGLDPLYFSLSPDGEGYAALVQEPAWRWAVGVGRRW
ncbi:MAG: hypothetical protein JXX28_03440 [Deltaproteobacteria bacterium]|nr:hypothetical protein [Deltaproteobacteria bacterium]